MKAQLSKKIDSLSEYCEKNGVHFILVVADGKDATSTVNGIAGEIVAAILMTPDESVKDVIKMASSEIIKSEILSKYKQS